MNKYYEVRSQFFDDGSVVANIMGMVEASRKPVTKARSLKRCDVYLDYFSTKDEAIRFIDEARFV